MSEGDKDGIRTEQVNNGAEDLRADAGELRGRPALDGEDVRAVHRRHRARKLGL